MNERDISIKDVKNSIRFGEVIESYENDKPFPSKLSMYAASKLIHVVYAESEEEIIIITTYEPSLEKWENDFKIRKKI